MTKLTTILFLLMCVGCNEPEPKQSYTVHFSKHVAFDSVNVFWVSPLITEKELKDRFGITIQKIDND